MMSGAYTDLQCLEKSLAGPIYLNTEIKISGSGRLCTAVIKYTSHNLGRRQFISAYNSTSLREVRTGT